MKKYKNHLQPIPELNKDTLNLIYLETKESIKFQMEVVKELESKASGVIRFVGILIGVGLTLIQFLTKSELFNNYNIQNISILVFYILGITFFLISLIYAFAGYRVSRYRVDPNPKKLIDQFLYNDYLKLDLVKSYIPSP